MKTYKLALTLLLFILFSITTTPITVHAEGRQVVFFKETTCLICAEVQGYLDGPGGAYTESLDYLKMLAEQGDGVDVIVIDIMKPDLAETLPSNLVYDDLNFLNSDIFAGFTVAYGIEGSDAAVPIIFAGNEFYMGFTDIKDGVESGEIYDNAADSLRTVNVVEGQLFDDITGIAGFITVLFAGFLDGFNPCAIAMLLLFVSLLGFSENKKILITVSVTYIFALFVSYFLIGTFLLNFLIQFSQQALIINKVISWIVALLCSFLFLFNFYDFIVTKRQEYGKVKNQLPKWIQRYNKKLIKAFTNIMNEDNNKGLASVLVLTFVLGVLLSVTELICTGQIYLGIIYGIHYLESAYAYILLLFYNIMFVLPLIVIAVVAIKGKGVMSTSNWIREHMHIIKFFNAMLFLVIAIYYFTRIF